MEGPRGEDGGAFGAGPLAGVKVVELAAFLAAPFATMMLADLGAEVVKVEPPHGDAFRRFLRPKTAMSAEFVNLNRNKQSITADLKRPGDLAVVRALLAGSDVVVANWRPGAGERLGLGDEQLADLNPSLIRCYLTGFGSDGPDARQPVFDGIVQARSAMTEAFAHDGVPAIAPHYMADAITGSMLAQAVLAALVARGRTGRGERVDVAMLDALAYFNFPSMMAPRTFVDQPPEAREPTPNRPIRGADGWLIIAAVTRSQIIGACKAVGLPDLGPELLRDKDTNRMIGTLLERVEDVTRTRPVAASLARFAEHDVPAAKCLTADEHLEDPQVRHNALYEVTDVEGLGRVRHVRYFARFSSAPKLGMRSAPPPLTPLPPGSGDPQA